MAGVLRNKKVCLITPGHISSNPRLVKEADALTKAGLQVHIIFTQYVAYLVEFDARILQSHTAWTYDCLDWTGLNTSSKAIRFKSGLKQRLTNRKEVASNRHFKWQYHKAIACKADLYIAHNLGALPVAVKAAQTNGAKCGFDAEDFHRNEASDDIHDAWVRLKAALEDRYIPRLDYMTAASPLIAGKYQQIYQREVTAVLNVFPKTSLTATCTSEHQPLSLFWFSQTIGEGRGLEEVISAIAECPFSVNLHLLGNITLDYKEQLLCLLGKSESTIIFHHPVFPDELFSIAGQFDIGLAAEPSVPLNRNICLTNKIFTYLQSGLAILATHTQAQAAFIKQYPLTGRLYDSPQAFCNLLTEFHTNRNLLHQTKQSAYQAGQLELNWDVEGKKWLNVVHNCLPIN